MKKSWRSSENYVFHRDLFNQCCQKNTSAWEWTLTDTALLEFSLVFCYLTPHSLFIVGLHFNSQLGRVVPSGLVLVVEATVPQPMPSHTAALVPLCLHLFVYTQLLQKTSLQTFPSSLSHHTHKGPVSLFPSQDTGMYQSLVIPSSKLRIAELRRVSAEQHGLNWKSPTCCFSPLVRHCAIFTSCFNRSNSTTLYIHLCLHTISFSQFPFEEIFTGQEPDTVAPGGLLTKEQIISITAIRTGAFLTTCPPWALYKRAPSWVSDPLLTLNRIILKLITTTTIIPP